MIVIVSLFIGVVVAAAAYHFIHGEAWLPGELRRGKLVWNEDQMSTTTPFPVVGRFDRVYRREDGLHVPLEYKNRDVTRLYESDGAQLSLQAWLLRRNGHKTAPHGYVVVRERKNGRTKALKVDLAGDAECEGMIQRHIDLLNGRQKPRKKLDGRCRSCGHAGVC